MIRRAKNQDIPAIMAMLHEMHAASKYAGRGEISDKAAESLLLSAIAQQGQSGPQGSHVVIAERDGEAIGFMIGSLDRVYSVGNKLTANDIFLYVRPRSPFAATIGLVNSYISWASSKKAVIEIMLSWSDALPGAAAIETLYRRKGFVKTGEMYEMRLDAEERRAVA